MQNKRIFISRNESSYNSELSIQTNIANQYNELAKKLPEYCKRDFNEYVTNSDYYIEEFKTYCETAINLPITIGKKMEMVNDTYFKYRDELDNLKHQMNQQIITHKDFSNGQLTTEAKLKLSERYSLYAEGKNIPIYELAIDVQNKLNKISELLEQNNKSKLMEFSNFNQRYFKRLGTGIEFDFTNLLF